MNTYAYMEIEPLSTAFTHLHVHECIHTQTWRLSYSSLSQKVLHCNATATPRQYTATHPATPPATHLATHPATPTNLEIKPLVTLTQGVPANAVLVFVLAHPVPYQLAVMPLVLACVCYVHIRKCIYIHLYVNLYISVSLRIHIYVCVNTCTCI